MRIPLFVFRFGVISTIAIVSLLTVAPCVEAAKTKVVYVPAITLMPAVVQADGQPRVYMTPAGAGLWNDTLPIRRGDRINLNVAVATGGGDLGRVIVRLDNVKLVELASSPWTTVIDTAKLTAGTHLVEAWAETKADHPQSATKTLSFTLVDELPAVAVAASDEQLDHVTIVNRDVAPPDFLSGAASDPAATVRLRSMDPAADRLLIAQDGALEISAPTMLWVEGQPGSTAVKFAYEIVRDGAPIASSPKAGSLQYQRMNIEPRTESHPGLRPGSVTLFVWGIDASGKIGDPVRQDVTISDMGTH